jgi:hypothetical protein
MLFGDHLFDVKGAVIVIILVQAAVLTAAACPRSDKGPERGIHHSLGELARRWRALDLRKATKVLYET